MLHSQTLLNLELILLVSKPFGIIPLFWQIAIRNYSSVFHFSELLLFGAIHDCGKFFVINPFIDKTVSELFLFGTIPSCQFYDIVYVDAADSCNSLEFLLDTTTSTRQWNIKVTQISCFDELRPPSGCTQYFYGSTGTFKVMEFKLLII